MFCKSDNKSVVSLTILCENEDYKKSNQYTGCPESHHTTLKFNKNFKNDFKNMFNISKCTTYKRLFFPKKFLPVDH